VIAPDVLIKNTVQDVIAVIKADKDIQAGDQKKIIALVDAKVLPNFDFSRMTQLAVGKYWRTATPQQKQSLVNGISQYAGKNLYQSLHGISRSNGRGETGQDGNR